MSRYSRVPVTTAGAAVVRTWLLGWPAIGQLILDMALAVVYLVVVVLALVAIVLLPVLLIGFPLLIAVLAVALGLGYVERGRLFALPGSRSCRPRHRPPVNRRGGACYSSAGDGARCCTSPPCPSGD